MSQRKPFTLTEGVVKPCLKIIGQEIHGGAMPVTKVQKLALSNKTMQKSCSLTDASLEELFWTSFVMQPALGWN